MSMLVTRYWTQPFDILGYRTRLAELVRKWNKSFLLFSMLALAIDPLFFFVPILDGTQKCLDIDRKLLIALCSIRSFVDLLSIIHTIIQFLTRYSPKYHYYLVGWRFGNHAYLHKRSSYPRSHLISDLLASLPIPQALFISIFFLKEPSPFLMTNLLKLLIICQFVPRIIRLNLFYKKVTKEYGFIIEVAWAGAALNFLLYLLAGHFIGSLGYLFAIESKLRCWTVACQMHNCDSRYLYRGEGRVGDFGFLNTSCPLLERNEIKDSKSFDFGIFLDILRTGLLETTDLPNKMLHLSLWGLQSLSSLAQGLKASMYYEEILFVYFIVVIGLFLFGLLLGKMQQYIQSYSSFNSRLEEMKEKRQAAEVLMSEADFPDELRMQVRNHNRYKWNMSKGVELDDFVEDLPRDIRRDVMRYLCLHILKKVPTFIDMEDHLYDTMCESVKQVFYMPNTLITREGYPIDEIVFITSGNVSEESVCYKYRDECTRETVGDELLGWALRLVPGDFPIADSTVTAIDSVQGFALMIDDVKFLISRFSPSTHKRVEHYFKNYSKSWRVRAASHIQAQWRERRRFIIAKNRRRIWAANRIKAAWRKYCGWNEEEERRRIWAAQRIQAAWHSHCRSRMDTSTPN